MKEETLQDKVCIIVGSSSGMGEATARRFAEAGARVILSARRGNELKRIADSIGDKALVVPADVQKTEEVLYLIETVVAKVGRIDILVYSVGTNIPDRSLKELSLETWEMMLKTNLSGAFCCTRAVLPVMRKQKCGLIIYISSAAVPYPDTSGVSYQASKHGLSGLAYGTFREEKENGIRTSVIFPGFTNTPLAFKRPAPTPPEMLAQALQPQDVAETCLFVASLPERAYVPQLVLMPTALA